MSNNKNRESKEEITNSKDRQPSDTNKKLPDNRNNAQDESISTADDISNGKYSKTETRKEVKDFDTIRSGH